MRLNHLQQGLQEFLGEEIRVAGWWGRASCRLQDSSWIGGKKLNLEPFVFSSSLMRNLTLILEDVTHWCLIYMLMRLMRKYVDSGSLLVGNRFIITERIIIATSC